MPASCLLILPLRTFSQRRLHVNDFLPRGACTGGVPRRPAPAVPGSLGLPHEPLTMAPCHTIWPA